MNSCDLCESYIADWLCLPLAQNDIFLTIVKNKNLKKVSNILAKEIYKIFGNMPILHKYFMKNMLDNIANNMRSKFNSYSIFSSFRNLPPEHAEEIKKNICIEFVRFLSENGYKSNIDYIIYVIEDNSVIVRSDIKNIKMWLGKILISIWNDINMIHYEHTTKEYNDMIPLYTNLKNWMLKGDASSKMKSVFPVPTKNLIINLEHL